MAGNRQERELINGETWLNCQDGEFILYSVDDVIYQRLIISKPMIVTCERGCNGKKTVRSCAPCKK